jgi:hypothetical protein
MGKFAATGWMVAAFAIAVAVGEYYLFAQQKNAALAEQAAEYEAKMQKVQADAQAAVKKAQDDATAQLTVIQTELDFQRLPDLPLKTVFRQGGVLYVESELEDAFDCKVRLFRPSNSATLEVDFMIKARTFQDLGAIGNWVFARGDKVEFVKAGYKPRALVVP